MSSHGNCHVRNKFMTVTVCVITVHNGDIANECACTLLSVLGVWCIMFAQGECKQCWFSSISCLQVLSFTGVMNKWHLLVYCSRSLHRLFDCLVVV